ncbi:hypothetical protein CH252_19095 [Rhodococcus sp. 06-1477-1B]|nr:hypothetical protein CH252_19095 [Rhodococcus sp. 06-1477-1B]
MAGKRTSTRRFHELRDQFFEEGKAQDADPETRLLANCWLCRGRIDYNVEPSSTPDSHNLDHFHTVEDRPDLQEDWDNFRHAHALCNGNRGKGNPVVELGEAVADWW